MRKGVKKCLVCGRMKKTAEMQMVVELQICRKSAHQQPFVHIGLDCFRSIMVNTVNLTLNVLDFGLPLCLSDQLG